MSTYRVGKKCPDFEYPREVEEHADYWYDETCTT